MCTCSASCHSCRYRKLRIDFLLPKAAVHRITGLSARLRESTVSFDDDVVRQERPTLAVEDDCMSVWPCIGTH